MADTGPCEIDVRPFTQAEWADLTDEFGDLSLLQTWEWAEAKARTGRWRVERAVFTAGDRRVGAVQALTKEVPGAGLAWVNRGPLWQTSREGDRTWLDPLLAAMRRYWVEQRGLYLRVAPAVCQSDGPFLAPAGFRPTAERGWASSRVDLTLPLELLRGRLDRKWRNGLTRAEQHKLSIEIGTKRAFDALVSEYEALLARRQFATTISPIFLRCLHHLAGSSGRLVAITAADAGRVAGAVLIARYGRTAEYLAGAVNDLGRRLNAGNLLLWTAVREMRALGSAHFDLGGTDPARTPSAILHFKAGLGAVQYVYVNEVEADRGRCRDRVVRWGVLRARRSVS